MHKLVFFKGESILNKGIKSSTLPTSYSLKIVYLPRNVDQCILQRHFIQLEIQNKESENISHLPRKSK